MVKQNFDGQYARRTARIVTIEVLFHHGERRKISQSALVEYITEKGNPRNQKGVREVEITFPSDYLQGRGENHRHPRGRVGL